MAAANRLCDRLEEAIFICELLLGMTDAEIDEAEKYYGGYEETEEENDASAEI